MPGGVTEAGAAGICGLLDPDESRRLGCSVYGGFAEMMHHGWFAEVYHRKGITCPAVDWPALARKEVAPPFVPPEDLRPVEPPADDVLNPHAYGLPGEGGDTWAPQFDKFGPTLDVPGVHRLEPEAGQAAPAQDRRVRGGGGSASSYVPSHPILFLALHARATPRRRRTISST